MKSSTDRPNSKKSDACELLNSSYCENFLKFYLTLQDAIILRSSKKPLEYWRFCRFSGCPLFRIFLPDFTNYEEPIHIKVNFLIFSITSFCKKESEKGRRGYRHPNKSMTDLASRFSNENKIRLKMTKDILIQVSLCEMTTMHVDKRVINVHLRTSSIRN